MIIRLHSRPYGEDEYVVCPHEPVTVAELHDRMIKRARVIEGSYAFRLIDDLYAAIFLQSLDLKADYKGYFAREYESFAEYLRHRTSFSSDIVTMLIRLFHDSTGIYHFHPGYSFLAEGYGVEFLTRLLEDEPTGETL